MNTETDDRTGFDERYRRLGEPFPPVADTPADLGPGLRDDRGVLTWRGIEYARIIGFRPLRMDLFRPEASTPMPVVIAIHGGAFQMGSRRLNDVLTPMVDALLARGIAVVSLEYRLSGEAIFPALVNDAKAAVRWLRRYGHDLGLRPDVIGTWGESAGGYLSVFLGLNTVAEDLEGSAGVTGVSTEIQATVAWYPPTNFLTMDAQAPADALMVHDPADSPESALVGGPIQDLREATLRAAPVSHVNAAAAPMLLIHGTRDRLVPFGQSAELAAALAAAGGNVRLHTIEGGDHVFDGMPLEPIAEMSADFLAQHLR